MAWADHLDLKLFLEANRVEDAGRRCQQLNEHGVTTLNEFAALNNKRLFEWGIADHERDYVCTSALPRAQELLQNSPRDLAVVKQQLLVRARMH